LLLEKVPSNPPKKNEKFDQRFNAIAANIDPTKMLPGSVPPKPRTSLSPSSDGLAQAKIDPSTSLPNTVPPSISSALLGNEVKDAANNANFVDPKKLEDEAELPLSMMQNQPKSLNALEPGSIVIPPMQSNMDLLTTESKESQPPIAFASLNPATTILTEDNNNVTNNNDEEKMDKPEQTIGDDLDMNAESLNNNGGNNDANNAENNAMDSTKANANIDNENNSPFKLGFLAVPAINDPNTIPAPIAAPAKPTVHNPAPINLAAKTIYYIFFLSNSR